MTKRWLKFGAHLANKRESNYHHIGHYYIWAPRFWLQSETQKPQKKFSPNRMKFGMAKPCKRFGGGFRGANRSPLRQSLLIVPADCSFFGLNRASKEEGRGIIRQPDYKCTALRCRVDVQRLYWSLELTFFRAQPKRDWFVNWKVNKSRISQSNVSLICAITSVKFHWFTLTWLHHKSA